MKTEGEWTIAEGYADIEALGPAHPRDQLLDRNAPGGPTPVWRTVAHAMNYNPHYNGKIRRRTCLFAQPSPELDHFIL